MNWEVRIPFRHRDDPVAEIGFAARELPEDERAIARAIAMEAILAGQETVGDLLDAIERSSVEQRRALLDRARTEVGMETTGVIDRRDAERKIEAKFADFDLVNEPPPSPRWSPLQSCPECGALPMKEGGGGWAEVDCEQWWCLAHRAGHEEDMQPHEPAYIGVNENGAPIPSAKEAARIEEWHRARQAEEDREREKRKAEEDAEAEAIEAARQRWEEEGEFSLMGFKVRPRSLRIIE